MTAPETAEKGRGLRLPHFRRPREEIPHIPPDGPTTSPEDALRYAATLAARLLVITAFIYVLVLLLNQISLVTITITVAVMLSAILRPIVNGAVHTGVPRWLAAPLVFLLGMGSIGSALWFVVTQITNNMDTIVSRLNEAGFAILAWLQEGPAQMSPDQVNQLSTQLAQRLANAQGDIATGALATASSLLGVIAGSLLCLFSLLFLLLDDGAIWAWVVGLTPAREHLRVQTGGAVAWRTLVAYMRSTILLALINALTMVPIMMFAKMDLVVPLAVLLFLGSLIPMIGMLVVGAVLMLVALVMQGPVTALGIGVALSLVIQLEGNLLNPYILGKAVRIHPLAILATVTAGTLVGGVFGAFVAVPLVAIVNNVVSAVRRPQRDDSADLVQSGDVVADVTAEFEAAAREAAGSAPPMPQSEPPALSDPVDAVVGGPSGPARATAPASPAGS